MFPVTCFNAILLILLRLNPCGQKVYQVCGSDPRKKILRFLSSEAYLKTKVIFDLVDVNFF